MKRILMILSVILFLFSCGETNKSEKTESSEVNDSQNVEDQIVGKWKLTHTKGREMEEGEESYMIIKDDGTFQSIVRDKISEYNKTSENNWSIKDNQFCKTNKEINFEICGSFNLEGDKLEWNTEDMGIFKYRKVN